MDEIATLEAMLSSRRGTCPDCAEERQLLPVDEDGLELCCLECGAAFGSWQRWTVPASPPAPSHVA